jgi:hypothetical protein
MSIYIYIYIYINWIVIQDYLVYDSKYEITKYFLCDEVMVGEKLELASCCSMDNLVNICELDFEFE